MGARCGCCRQCMFLAMHPAHLAALSIVLGLLQVLEPDCFENLTAEGTTWTRTPYRAFYRAMYGVANTLRKMGRCACVACCSCTHDQRERGAWRTAYGVVNRLPARWAGAFEVWYRFCAPVYLASLCIESTRPHMSWLTRCSRWEGGHCGQFTLCSCIAAAFVFLQLTEIGCSLQCTLLAARPLLSSLQMQ
jgi:hypothetical protein